MTKHINLSQNELWALLIRTFEALYGHERDYYDMARTVLWLECHGHHGVEALVEALPALKRKILPKPTLTKRDCAHVVLDGKGRSLFCLGRTICDLAMASAAEHSVGRIDIINVLDAGALIGVLSYASGQGFAAALLGKSLTAVIAPNAACPKIYERKPNETTDEMINLIISQVECDLQIYLPDELGAPMAPKTQSDYFEASLERGLPIKYIHYESLNRVADRVFVEASAESRRGAGE